MFVSSPPFVGSLIPSAFCATLMCNSGPTNRADYSVGVLRMALKSVAVTAGDQYGRLTVIEELEPLETRSQKRRNVIRIVLCKCQCGQVVNVRLQHIRSGATVSCGCAAKENGKTHGGHGTTTYEIWKTMRQRCANTGNQKFLAYGGRGISVCERWSDYAKFVEDMGECPAGHSIDRLDNDGNYEPQNCRWATSIQQARNKRNNHLLEYNGVTKCLSEWAEVLGVSRILIRDRLRLGWTIKDAFETPVIHRSKSKELKGGAT